ncbi:MAG: hypothetical protein OXT65_10445 [Alphaproteobacteria bacterium]|nr:hypothetical protein [Alphaproteobacteria bacterium]
MSKSAFYKALETQGRDGTSNDLIDMLNKFGNDEAAVEALQRGVDKRLSREDRGNYIENGTTGYPEAARKSRLMVEFHSATGAFSNRTPAPTAANGNDKLDIILQKLENLSDRVERLESRRKGPRNSL